MRSDTRRLTSWLLVLVLGSPGLAVGQTVKPADLAGTWVYRRDGGAIADSLKGQLVVTYLKIDPKGTFAYDGQIKKNDGQWHSYGIGWTKGSWALTADTIRFKDDKIAYAYRVGLKEGRLAFWDWQMWNANRRDEKCAQKVFERFEASKPLTLPPLPQVTIQTADLIGTWAGTLETKHVGTVTDTLAFGSRDPSKSSGHLTSKHHGWNPYGRGDHYNSSGQWALLPGDELTGSGILGRYRVVLYNGELVPCSPVRPVFKRVGP